MYKRQRQTRLKAHQNFEKICCVCFLNCRMFVCHTHGWVLLPIHSIHCRISVHKKVFTMPWAIVVLVCQWQVISVCAPVKKYSAWRTGSPASIQLSFQPVRCIMAIRGFCLQRLPGTAAATSLREQESSVVKHSNATNESINTKCFKSMEKMAINPVTTLFSIISGTFINHPCGSSAFVPQPRYSS